MIYATIDYYILKCIISQLLESNQRYPYCDDRSPTICRAPLLITTSIRTKFGLCRR